MDERYRLYLTSSPPLLCLSLLLCSRPDQTPLFNLFSEMRGSDVAQVVPVQDNSLKLERMKAFHKMVLATVSRVKFKRGISSVV